MLTGNNFIEHSIMGAISFFKESVFAEQYALKKGFLQLLDLRIKTITFLMFIVLTILAKNVCVLFYLYTLCLLLGCISKINLWFFLKRTLIFIPLFSIFIAIPALFSIFTPGEAMLALNIFGIKFTITHQGFFVASLLVARVITSVSFVVLLTLTTKHFELLKVLRIFGIPQIFVMTIGMCYRYIFLFVEIIENIYLAVKSRIGSKIHYKKGQHLAAWNIASLWQRSYQLNENVYKAMLSRGYCGESVTMDDFKLKIKDLLWLFLIILISIGIIWII
ncbi:MAG: cobalt ECF transporter T component CbiQ [Elusimicrobiota bacterium]